MRQNVFPLTARFLGALSIVLAMASCGPKAPETAAPAAPQAAALKVPGTVTIGMLPKLVNIDYFDACKRGASQVAGELGITLIYDGPTEPSGSEQNKFFDTWTRLGVQAICVAPNQPKTIRRF